MDDLEGAERQKFQQPGDDSGAVAGPDLGGAICLGTGGIQAVVGFLSGFGSRPRSSSN